MISKQLTNKNQRIGYYKAILLASSILVVIWVILTIQSSMNKKFEDKKAQAAAKAISSEFDLEIINALQDKYNPTELELRKINPYTKSSAPGKKVVDIYFQESSSSEPRQSSPSAELIPAQFLLEPLAN